jgi:ferric-dicitrate binding protein FerR (iron transport regulator)
MEENYKLSKWLNDEMSQEELAEFQSSDDFSIYDKIKKYSAQLDTQAFDEQKALSKILNTPKKEVKTIPLYQNWFMKIAAVLVIGFGIVFMYTNFISITKVASFASRTEFTLPDNSEVVLNSGSKIHYNSLNWDNNRNLKLEGEAYFKVAKGKKFTVETAIGKVTVLGTQFNVKQYQESFEVTCYEGKVKVNSETKEFILTKGMVVVFRNDENIPIPFTTTTKPEWLENEMNFYQERLTNVIEEFERQFDVTIKLNSKENSQLFTGTIPSKNLDTALQILCSTYHLKPVKKEKNTIILENN